MKNKKIFSFIEEYKKSWNFIRESKNFIYSVIGIFFVFSLIGFFITTPTIMAEQILKFIEKLLLKTQGMGHFELMKFIFFNNIQSSFFGMIFGVFLGIFPIVAVVANGYILGFVASLVVNSEGISVLWRLFPHGIFELPAIFISLGLGLKIGTFIFQRKKLESLKKYFLNSLRVFLFIVLPLLIIAAIIEGSLIYLFG
tara:strand:+ start:450 stop:1043 length:594 start_codon:yes stop_codon:yes gene_type:complete